MPLDKILKLHTILLKEVKMESLITLWSIKFKNVFKRQRKGAAVLETVLLIIVAVVIIGLILNFFVGKDATGKTFLGRIFAQIEEFLNLAPDIKQ